MVKVTKAKEVLRRYAAGERNFRGLNLRGQSFKGADLSGADFSEADLRSTKFNEATLRGVNFTGARCGLQKRWVIVGLIVTTALATVSGFFPIINSFLITSIFDSTDLAGQIMGWVALVVPIIFQLALVRKGAVAGIVAGAVGVVAGAIVVGVVAVVGTVAVAGVITRAIGTAVGVLGAVA